MPFVHGTDLAHLLAREPRLPVPRALAIVRQIASGLRAAHDVGVVHRDLKPANILLDEEGRAQITDFGIARSTDAATIATAAGAIMGTLAYMAPEQASGQPVDQRADIYALGLICYEMLSGRPSAAGGESALALLMQRSRQAPPPLRTIDPAIPEPLERIVARCLEPDPAARYQRTADLEADLDRLDASGHEKAGPIVPPAPARQRPWGWVAAALFAVLAVALAAWSLTRGTPAGPEETPHEPLSVLVADFENTTGDAVFEGALEQALTLAIEGATFITSYPRTTAQNVLVNRIKAGPALDADGARLVAASEGIGAILSGGIAPSGSGYRLSVKAIDPSNGGQLALAEASAGSKDAVLEGVRRIAAQLRTQLGDATPESQQLAREETVTAGSLEALHSYSRAQELTTGGRPEESLGHYQEAIQRDPQFGRAYSGLATALFNLGRRDESLKVWKQALALTDRMTEREKYRTLGAYYLGPGSDYTRAIESFTQLVEQYPGDSAALTNLAYAHFMTRDFARAMEVGARNAKVSPRDMRARGNYALYAMYAGDFAAAEREAQGVLAENPAQYKAYLPLAAARFAAGDHAGMREAYERMRATGGAGASLAVDGLADAAMYEGRLADAGGVLADALAADEKRGARDAAARRLASLAELHALAGRNQDAVAAARRAVSLVRDHAVLVRAALVFAHAGGPADALAIARELAADFQPQRRAYAAVIEGEMARGAGRLVDAGDHYTRAIEMADLWMARYLRGVTWAQAERHPQAIAELEESLQKRRGEAVALFLDDVPTFRVLAPGTYWLARAQDGLGTAASAAENYRKFLALRPESPRDPLVVDAQKRLAALAR
jgi:tetratricopeptide (TPR) repeat protein